MRPHPQWKLVPDKRQNPPSAACAWASILNTERTCDGGVDAHGGSKRAQGQPLPHRHRKPLHDIACVGAKDVQAKHALLLGTDMRGRVRRYRLRNLRHSFHVARCLRAARPTPQQRTQRNSGNAAVPCDTDNRVHQPVKAHRTQSHTFSGVPSAPTRCATAISSVSNCRWYTCARARTGDQHAVPTQDSHRHAGTSTLSAPSFAMAASSLKPTHAYSSGVKTAVAT